MNLESDTSFVTLGRGYLTDLFPKFVLSVNKVIVLKVCCEIILNKIQYKEREGEIYNNVWHITSTWVLVIIVCSGGDGVISSPRIG